MAFKARVFPEERLEQSLNWPKLRCCLKLGLKDQYKAEQGGAVESRSGLATCTDAGEWKYSGSRDSGRPQPTVRIRS